MIDGIKKLTTALKRRLDPTLRVMVEVGYLNEELKRTETGVHQLLNFIEETNKDAFVEYLKGIKAERIAEAKEEAGN